MKKLLKNWKWFGLTAILILLIALFLRLYNLTILPVFADEAIYIRWSQVMSNEPTLRFLPLSDGKQPLFMWVLMFAVRKLGDPLFVGRLLSVVSGMGTIIGVGVLSYYLFRSKIAALGASILWAISPFSLFFDRMALVDAMLTCFGVWTCFFALVTAKTKRWDTAMLTGFTLGGALLTKSPAIFFVLLLPTTILFSDFPKRKKLPLYLIKLVALFGVTLLIAFAMYNILRLGPNFHLIGSRNIDYVHPLSRIYTHPLDPIQPHLSRAIEWLWIWGPSVLIFLIIGGAIVSLKKFPRKGLVLVAWGLLPILINAEYAKVFTARYILFSLPYLYILASTLLLYKNKLIWLLFVAWGMHAIYINYLLLTDPVRAPIPRSERSGYLEEWTSGTGIKEVAQILKDEHAKDPNTQIVVGTEGFFGTLPDGLQIYMQDVPGVVIIGVGLDIGDVHQSLKDSKKAGNKTYLVANSSRLKFKKDFSEYGLKVVASFAKASRPEGIREFFHYGDHDTFYLLEVL